MDRTCSGRHGSIRRLNDSTEATSTSIHSERGAPQAGRLSTFLPRVQRERIHSRGSLPTGPEQIVRDGALAFVDISGFTALTERLAPRGGLGAEQLSGLLNRFYGRLADLGEAWGGDLVAFAGDAALVLWPADAACSLSEATLRAAAFAIEAQKELSDFDAGEGIRLQIRVSIGAGGFQDEELGGVHGRWLHVLAGDPLDQVTRADALGAVGLIVASPDAVGLLGGAAETASLGPDGSSLEGLLPVTRPSGPPEPPDPAAALMAAFVPEVVATRLLAGQRDFLAEFRRVSILFMRLDIPDAGDLGARHGAIVSFQEAVARFEGSVYQCLRDDKGFVAIAAFGMPPHSHEDDPARASLAALEIRERLREADLSCAAGIASGRIFCGDYGSATRRHYALVGSPINLAARLMQAAGKGGVLADPSTRRAAEGRVAFGAPHEIPVKGRTEPLLVAEPLGRQASAGPSRPDAELIGRRSELRSLTEAVDLLLKGEHPGPRLVAAEAGMGKSMLVEGLARHALSAGARVLRAHADSIEAATPYFAFRGLFEELLAPEDPGSPEAWLSAAEALLAGDPELTPLLPLLDPVVPVALADNEGTRPLEGAARAANTLRVLGGLIAAAAHRQPSVLVLEDGHWTDSASWSLVARLARSVDEVALVVTTRPWEEEPAVWRELAGRPGALAVELGPLAAAELVQVAAAQLGCDELPIPLAQLLEARAEGNPFHAQEIALSLRDAELIEVEEGHCRIVSEAGLANVEVPETLQGVITDRIDRLHAGSQLTLKVGSVIGRLFETHLLSKVHPLEAARAEIPAHLEALRGADLIQPERSASLFRHAVIHETVYGLLAFAQRRELHRATARALEERHAGALDPVVPRLAHHYVEGDLPQQALAALRRSGELALDAHALEEAVAFFERALALDGESAEGLSCFDRMETGRLLSQARYGLSQYESVREAGYAALRSGGFRTPGRLGSLAAELGVWFTQAVRERLGFRRAARRGGDAYHECVSAMNTLAEVIAALRFEGRIAELLHATLQLYNLSGRIEPAPEVGPTRGAYAMLLTILGFQEAGERRARRGCEEALAIGDTIHRIQGPCMLGQILLMRGQCEEAVELQRVAVRTSEELGRGLWRHRSWACLGDALLATGCFGEARAAMRRAHELASDAEPQAAGLMIALAALARLRTGEDEPAREELEEGVSASRDHPAALPLFTCLGGLAEAQLRTGRLEEALESAQEAAAISERSSEVSSYMPGIHGFSGACQVYLELWQRADTPGPEPPLLTSQQAKRAATNACRAFRSFTRIFPSAKPRYFLFEGLRQLRLGRARRALSFWARAQRMAEDTGQPYELGLALLLQGRHSTDAAAADLVARAATLFDAHDLAFELALCRDPSLAKD